MTDIVAAISFLLLPLFGVAVWGVDAARRAPWTARVAISAPAGALMVAAVMTAMSIAHLTWSRTAMIVALSVIVIGSMAFVAKRPPLSTARRAPDGWTMAVVIFVVLTAYGSLTARETSSDLFYFWGPKAVRFFREGGISLEFLRRPDSVPFHPDYPPFLSVIYAWSHTFTPQFSFSAVLLTTPLILMAIAAIVHAYSGDAAGTLLVIATLAHAIAITWAAGAGEPPLLLFETLTIVAITFVNDSRSQAILGAIGAAGAAAMKIEGTTFVIAVVIGLVLVRRDFRRAALIGAAGALVFGGWFLFTRMFGISETYALLRQFPFRAAMVPRVLALIVPAGSYEMGWLSWIVPLALIALSGQWRRAALPLTISLLTICAATFFYSRGNDPTWWIATSAPRVLMTPLLALDIAVLAASGMKRASPVPEAARL